MWGMRFNANIGGLVLALALCAPALRGQEEEVGFREPLFFSEIDRDERTPQAVRVGGVVFVAAMGASGDTVQQQARTAYIRLQSVLGNYGLRMADAVQERVYLKQGASYEAAKAARLLVYGEGGGPALTMVEVAGFEDPSTLIEIELVAVANPEEE